MVSKWQKIAITMLHIPFVRQSPAMCGPAALAMVLAYYGEIKSEEQLSLLAGSSPEKGTTGEGMIAAAKAIGFNADIVDGATIPMVREWVSERRVPVIVDWFSGDDGHYAVVVDVTDSHIVMHDPERGPNQSLDLATFLRVWFDFPGDVIERSSDLILRRMIIVRPAGDITRP